MSVRFGHISSAGIRCFRTLGYAFGTLLLPLLVVAAGLVGTAQGELTMSGTCSAAWCQNDRDNAAASADALALVREQLPALGCDTTKRLSERVAVIPAPVQGEIHFDTTVVRAVPFQQAWVDAQARKVIVVGWCS